MGREKLREDASIIGCASRHYNINGFPQRHSGAFPGDMSLGIPFPGDKSPGKRRWGRLV
nr:hypothetical protein [Tanacetum cinerariifolium]